MSERLDQLAAQLGQMCEGVPVDVTNEATTLVLMAKCQGQALADAFRQNVDVDKKRESAQAAINVAAEMAKAKSLGEHHKAVKILRGMGLIANAIIDGKAEPTDEELGIASKCFIATACYETPDCMEVRQLRCFRDDALLTSPLGRLFVGLYYSVSPPVAHWLASRPRCRNAVRKHVLQPIVRQLLNRR